MTAKNLYLQKQWISGILVFGSFIIFLGCTFKAICANQLSYTSIEYDVQGRPYPVISVGDHKAQPA